MYLKNPILIIVFSLCPFIAWGQNEYKLAGHIKIKGGTSFPYQLAFTIKGSEVKGYSITKLKNNVQAKASIKGNINKTAQTISFTEFPFEDGDENTITCFVNATLSLNLSENKHLLKGEFKGKDHYNMYCGEGTIILNPSTALSKQMGANPQQQAANENTINVPPAKGQQAIANTKKSQPDEINHKGKTTKQPTKTGNKEQQQSKNNTRTSAQQIDPTLHTPKHHGQQKLPIQPADTLNDHEDGREYEITSGITQQFQWHSDTCILDIYDGGVIDGDKITVILNADEVLSKHTLTKQKYHMKLFLRGKVNTISIIAENLGKTPPNTANFILTDGKRHYKIKAFNDIGESAEITLKKK